MDDSTILITAWISGLAGLGFIWRTLRHPRPVVDLLALKDRNFALGCFFSFMAGVGIFSTIYLTPLFLGNLRGFSALDIGLAIFSTGIFQILSIPIYSWFANRVDLRWLMMIGLAAFALSMFFFTPITYDWGAEQLLLPQAFRGAAQQFAVAPAVTLTLGGLPPERLKLASGLFNLMRNLGGAIGIAMCGTVWNDRTNLHFSRLGDHLNMTNQAMDSQLDTLTQIWQQSGMDVATAHTAALKQLAAITFREAQTQAFADAFVLIMVGFIITTLMVLLMRKPAASAPPVTAEAH